jgi:glycosyltransferase involved in cell wall biosynthesis
VTRIHLVSLPHTLLTKSYDWCAYTAKLRRFVDMLVMAKHTPIVYGPDIHDDVHPAAEYVPIVDGADRLEWFGAEEWDTNHVFNHWDTEHPSWRTMNTRAADQIRQRWQPGDLLGLIAGRCQEQIVTELADLQPLVVEWGIGYSGVLTGSHKVFESYAWAHHVAGYYRTDDLAFFDTVIPNCFDSDDFEYSDQPGEYLLYMGRPNPRKGLPIIADIASRTDVPVLIAGQPGPEIPHTKYVGLVTGMEKAQLLAGARAVLVPTTYLEPFGGVAVEAMMSGTPVISTDWGAMTETVVTGVSGYRCRMLSEFLIAVDAIAGLDRQRVRDHALARYSTTVGSQLYGRYLDRVALLYGQGWYAGTTPGR